MSVVLAVLMGLFFLWAGYIIILSMLGLTFCMTTTFIDCGREWWHDREYRRRRRNR